MLHIYEFSIIFSKFQEVFYLVSLIHILTWAVKLNVDCGFPTSLTGNLYVVQGEALVRSSFWKEPHARIMEKVSVLQLSF